MRNALLFLAALFFCSTAAFAQQQSPEPSPSPSPATAPASALTGPATAQPSEVKTAQIKTTDAIKGNSKAGMSLPPEKAQPVRVQRFDKPPLIDGKLDDEAWKQAAVLKDFYQTNPGDNTSPSYPTETYLGYDSKNLYIAFHAHDDPAKVRATVVKRDEVLGAEDSIRILLDTYNDKRRAYVLVFNPFGVQQDGIRTEGSGVDFSVDIVMESKGILTEDGYTIEVAVPFKSLRYEAGKGKLWGVQVFRNILRLNSEQDSWMPLSRSDASILSQAGHITGLENISTEHTLELIPSLTLSETGKRLRSIPPSVLRANPGLLDQGRFVNEPLKFDVGLTAKYGITPTVTLDLAINPDFAQVEADQLVVTTNQRFPIFFPERRPFFLEGKEIFQTLVTVLHTRAIVDPDVAVKLSGKRERNSFGLLVASDNGPGNIIGDDRLRPGNFRFLDHNASIGVLRLKRDVGKENNLGLIATSYNFVDKHNEVGGFDGRFRLNKITTLDFQLLGSHSREFFYEPELDKNIYRTGNSFAYSVSYDVSGRNWGTSIFSEGYTKDYRAELGFNSRTNTNFNGFDLRYFSDPNEKKKVVSWWVESFHHFDYDFQGRSQIWESDATLGWNFQNNKTFWVAYRRGYERLIEEEFGAKRTASQEGIFFGSSERSTAKQHFVTSFSTQQKTYGGTIKAAYRMGTFDFDFGGGPKFPRVSPAFFRAQQAEAAGLCDVDNPPSICLEPLDPGSGNLLDITGNAYYQPTSALRLTLNYTKNRLTRDDNHLIAFDDNIYSLRGTYQFTRFMAARARVDYSTLSARARAQFLFAWTPNPGTALYIGYNDDVNRNAFSPINGFLEPGFRRNGRTFFIKMSYLFRRSFGG
ncbi:MAG TPA: DUF5916 domain-containing protein [Pyrinomonadaceae bacterium]|jgi:hypothetical protein|nr:DUF5916 domain-containing protein [Pyrinomonadaceae bacterium]